MHTDQQKNNLTTALLISVFFASICLAPAQPTHANSQSKAKKPGKNAKKNTTRKPDNKNKTETTVWYGKAIVFLFQKQATYQALEAKVYYAKGYGKFANFHSQSVGRVAIAGWRHSNTTEYQRAIVHEMTRGFLFRHVSNLSLPTWVERGLAKHTANDIIKQLGTSSSNDDLAKIALASHNNALGSDFFGTKPLQPWQHDIAVSLAGFMMKENDKGVATFINAIKAGYTQDDAFETFYEQSKSELLIDYAKHLRIGPIK